LDQTNFDLRWRLDFNSGGRPTFEAGHELALAQVDRPDRPGPGRPTPSCGLLAQVSSESLLIFSRIFSSWFVHRICFLARHVGYLWLFYCLILAKHWFTKTYGILSV
jgi:hypothetical protein